SHEGENETIDGERPDAPPKTAVGAPRDAGRCRLLQRRGAHRIRPVQISPTLPALWIRNRGRRSTFRTAHASSPVPCSCDSFPRAGLDPLQCRCLDLSLSTTLAFDVRPCVEILIGPLLESPRFSPRPASSS